MSEFQRRDEVERPLDEQVDNEARVSAPTALEMEKLPQAIYGATLSEGRDETAAALAQYTAGRARPQELIEWIDDVRQSQAKHPAVPKEPKEKDEPKGVLQDFQADSNLASGEIDSPPAGDADAHEPASASAVFGIDDDVAFMFPGRRKRQDGEDDDDETAESEKAPEENKSKNA